MQANVMLRHRDGHGGDRCPNWSPIADKPFVIITSEGESVRDAYKRLWNAAELPVCEECGGEYLLLPSIPMNIEGGSHGGFGGLH